MAKRTEAPKNPTPTAASAPNAVVSFDELDPKVKDQLMVEARTLLEEKIGGELRKHLADKITQDVRAQIIEEDMDRRRRRVVAFLGDVLPHLDRVGTYLTKHVCDRESVDDVKVKWPGTVSTSQSKMTVMGLIASIAYNFTCNDDGYGGRKLRGAINDKQQLAGFTWSDPLGEAAKI